MPLETATYTADLVTSNPAASDAVSTTDDHLRMIKGALKATFPNFSSAPLNSTQAQIDAAVGQVLTTGVTKASATGLVFTATESIQSTALGELDLVAGGNVVIAMTNGTAHVRGTLSVDSAINGPGVIPIGGMIMWLTDTLPTSGTWCWANGGVLSRTGNGAALYALTGTNYGAGDGVTTFNVINMQEAVPVGKSGMGGGTSPGLLASISAGLKGVLGGVFGTDTVTLGTLNLPPYTPAGNITNGAITFPNGGVTSAVTGTLGTVGTNSSGNKPVDLTSTLGPVQATSTFAGTPQGGTSVPLNNVGPRRVVNFIIRIG